jgi:hypothetical protein
MKINILFLSLLIFVGVAQSQHISFSKSKVLHLKSQVELLYTETEIRFYTHGFTGDQMKWDVIFDSLDNRWAFDACANGDCRIGLTDTGTFVTDYGVNDTTVYFRYHVNTKGFNGTSKIGIKVYHPNITNINDTMWMNITYYNPSTSVDEITNQVNYNFTVHDNSIVFAKNIHQIKLFNMIGQIISEELNITEIQKPSIKGLYLMEITPNPTSKSMIVKMYK